MKPVRTLFAAAVVLAAAVPSCFAQLTAEQKAADFRYLAGLYAKQYASYEWKRTLFDFDAMNLTPWLERVARTTDDLQFYDLCVEYVASFNDSHVPFILPSDFTASLGFTVDVYDGKVLIDSINRVRLPAGEYPFQIGDELASVDGRDVEELIREFGKYAPASNPRSNRRRAAARIVTRPQSRMPRAHELGESASVVVRLADGELRTFTIPWIKTGVPLHVGPVPSPKAGSARAAAPDGEEAVPAWMQAWIDVQHSAATDLVGELGTGARAPIFALPAGFEQRQGRAPADFFFSGSYVAEGRRIGFIRIPSYSSLAASVLAEFEREIAWFQENTDGLVVDNTRNPGGFLCFGENVVARLTPYPFRPTGYELRATWSRLNGFYNALSNARLVNADKWIIDQYEFLFSQLLSAYQENRGRTGPIPLCTPSLDRPAATDAAGQVIAYTRPLIMLIDEFSTSTADSVPAMIQDARRGPLFGWRTNGAGGTNITPASGAYSEGLAGIVLGLMTRKEPIATPGYPTSHYIENVGVQPDIEYDYMTKDNLVQRGRPFVDAFTAAILEQIGRR
jgi:hypothetical protein